MPRNVPHRHKCHLCGTMWQHVQDQSVGARKYHEAHNCPNPECDGNQRWIYSYADEQEPYPGAFEENHRAVNAADPGGSGGGSKGEDKSLMRLLEDIG